MFKYPWEVAGYHGARGLGKKSKASRFRNSSEVPSALGLEYWLLSRLFGTLVWRLQFEIVVLLLPNPDAVWFWIGERAPRALKTGRN